MKLLVLGNGFIGKYVSKYLGCPISDARIDDMYSIQKEINIYNPDIVINCIGKAGNPNVDWCENHIDETFRSNVFVPQILDMLCRSYKIKMVHIGSGCIYNNGIFSEEDAPNFIGSIYSKSKKEVEESLSKNVLQLRIRMPISSEPGDRNLITKLLKYDKILDMENSVTVIDDFLYALKLLIQKDAKGIFNVVNPVAVKHSEILNIYNKYSNVEKKFSIISIEELEKITIAPRSNCILSTNKLESFGIRLRTAPEAIEDCIKKYVKSENLCAA